MQVLCHADAAQSTNSMIVIAEAWIRMSTVVVRGR
jgi:hypothetical protein